MREMQTIVTDVRGVCQSVCLSVTRRRVQPVLAGSFCAAFANLIWPLVACCSVMGRDVPASGAKQTAHHQVSNSHRSVSYSAIYYCTVQYINLCVLRSFSVRQPCCLHRGR